MIFPAEMMSASPNILGKYRIIANEMSNIIFAKQMHHIAIGDASLQILTLIKSWGYCFRNLLASDPAFLIVEIIIALVFWLQQFHCILSKVWNCIPYHFTGKLIWIIQSLEI